MIKSDSIHFQHLKLTQRSSIIEDFEFHELDMFISFVSWEERSTAVAKARIHADSSVIYRFAGSTGDELKDKREQDLVRALSSKDHRIKKVVSEPSTECVSNFERLSEIVRLAVRKKGRPISLLLDISCCPKSILTFILGFCIANGFVRSIKFFYAHTRYESKLDSASDGDQIVFRFTDGEWSAVQIPYLEGAYRPSALRKLVVMMGAEIVTTESFLRRYQPDKLELVAPRPGVTKQIDGAVKRGVQSLMNRLEIPDRNLRDVAPHDAIGCATACRSFVERDEMMDVSLVCLGTKPHAIGAGIIAATVPQATLVCRIPKYYAQTPGRPTGEATVYEIKDLSVF